MGCGPCLGFNSECSNSDSAQLSGSEEEKEKRDPDKQSEEKEKEDDDDDDEKNPERAKGTRIDKEKGGSDEHCMGCIIRWEPLPPLESSNFCSLVGKAGGVACPPVGFRYLKLKGCHSTPPIS